MLFPEKLRQLRRESGMKQRDLAKRIGVDVPMYSRFEHGERRPRREQVVKLARAFDADANELVALWLAYSALNQIGNDPMAEEALVHLREALGHEEPQAAQPVQPAAPSPRVTVEIPQVAPADRHVVRDLGDNPVPQYIEGDALDTLAHMEDESVDCVVTAPPYWSLRRFNTEHITADSPEQFIAQLVAVMHEVRRVLKPSGSLWLNMADAYADHSQTGLPWRTALRLVDEQGWLLRNDVVWNKQMSAQDGTSSHLRNVHEFIFHLVKSEECYYNDDELRQYYNALNGRPAAKSADNSNLGARYRRNINFSTALSDEEKKNALAALEQTVARVLSGEIPQFRMSLREFPGQVQSEKSEKGRSINAQGFYILAYNKNGTMPGDVWTIAPEKSEIERYNVFPESLCHLMIAGTCPEGGLVLDPYCGTGTTCKVAFDLHRRALGIDVNGAYLKIARERVQQQPLSLF